MPIKYRKDKTHLVGSKDLHLLNYEDYYYRAYLWDTRDAMLANVLDGEGMDDRTRACCVHAKYLQCITSNAPVAIQAPHRLGEMHYVRGDWTDDVVAHECYHAVNNICHVFLLHPMLQIEYEERAAYIMGRLFHDCYHWLWDIDQHSSRWRRVNALDSFVGRCLAFGRLASGIGFQLK